MLGQLLLQDIERKSGDGEGVSLNGAELPLPSGLIDWKESNEPSEHQRTTAVTTPSRINEILREMEQDPELAQGTEGHDTGPGNLHASRRGGPEPGSDHPAHGAAG